MDNFNTPNALKPEPVPGLVVFLGNHLIKFLKARGSEKTTWIGIALIAITMVMDPSVFEQLRVAFVALRNHSTGGVLSALFSILLIVVKERTVH